MSGRHSALKSSRNDLRFDKPVLQVNFILGNVRKITSIIPTYNKINIICDYNLIVNTSFPKWCKLRATEDKGLKVYISMISASSVDKTFPCKELDHPEDQNEEEIEEYLRKMRGTKGKRGRLRK